MKLKKKRKKDIQTKINIKKSILILIMLISLTIAMITYWIYAYHHKYGRFYFNEIKLVSPKISDYIETNGNVIHLKNMDKDIINYFEKKQDNIINNNKIISTDIKKGIYDNILSVIINYTLEKENNTYEEIITINIDLKNNKILDSDKLLELSKTNYKKIATTIFDNNIKLPSNSNSTIIDSITDKELTVAEFNSSSEKYIIRIREKLPDIMKLYIEDNTLYGLVRLNEIDKVCYYTNKNNRLVNIKIEIGKI